MHIYKSIIILHETSSDFAVEDFSEKSFFLIRHLVWLAKKKKRLELLR